MTAADYKAKRLTLGTQPEVAALLGLDRTTIARREADNLPITREAELAIMSLKPKRKKS